MAEANPQYTKYNKKKTEKKEKKTNINMCFHGFENQYDKVAISLKRQLDTVNNNRIPFKTIFGYILSQFSLKLQ